MANTIDYAKVFASGAPSQREWSEEDYIRGWDSNGSVPPSVEQFDALQRQTDLKLKNLNERVDAAGEGGITEINDNVAPENNRDTIGNILDALAHQIKLLSGKQDWKVAPSTSLDNINLKALSSITGQANGVPVFLNSAELGLLMLSTLGASLLTAQDESTARASIRAAGTSVATQQANGLMSTVDKQKLDKIDETYVAGISISGKTVTITKGDGTTSTQTTQDTNTTYSAATQSSAGLMSAADKKKLDGVATGANAYTLPTASSSTLGGVKVGSNISLTSGTISMTKANVISALGYTPPTTNTTYSTGTASASGITKLYTGLGDNTDGTMTQKAIKAIVGTGGGITAASLAANGYVKFANGFIVQWGNNTSDTGTATTVTFPIAFTSACYAVTFGVHGSGTGKPDITRYNASSVSTTGFVRPEPQSGYSLYWIAVGK